MNNPFKQKHRADGAADAPGRTYGFDGTIHQTTELDVEVNDQGDVVAVWFRCQPLPFRQSNVEGARAKEMGRMYRGKMPILDAIHVIDS